MPHQFTQRRRVSFSETDLAGIMHFSNFFRWMEELEHAFYRSLGLSVHPMAHGFPDINTGWPRTKASAEFRLPLQFEEEVEVELLVAEMRTKAIRYAFRFWKNPDSSAARALYAEYRDGSYYREFRLSQDIDAARVSARMKDGVLELRLPKSALRKPRRISVHAA